MNIRSRNDRAISLSLPPPPQTIPYLNHFFIFLPISFKFTSFSNHTIELNKTAPHVRTYNLWNLAVTRDCQNSIYKALMQIR
jgi:hypothetical protein